MVRLVQSHSRLFNTPPLPPWRLSDQNDTALDQRLFGEWKTARDLISSLDGTLSDLRKFGFSFITAILAADSVLGQTTKSAAIVLSPQVKLAVFISTLFLIAGLYATDMYYKSVQKAAAERAKEIENHFKKGGLTTIIGKYYEAMHLWLYSELLYVFFAIACGILGAVVLYPEYDLIGTFAISTALTILFIVALPHLTRKPNLYPSPEPKPHPASGS